MARDVWGMLWVLDLRYMHPMHLPWISISTNIRMRPLEHGRPIDMTDVSIKITQWDNTILPLFSSLDNSHPIAAPPFK